MGAQPLNHIRLIETTRTVACQAPLSREFSRQEYRSGLPFPAPGDLPDPGIELASLVSPALEVGSLPLRHLGRSIQNLHIACSWCFKPHRSEKQSQISEKQYFYFYFTDLKTLLPQDLNLLLYFSGNSCFLIYQCLTFITSLYYIFTQMSSSS